MIAFRSSRGVSQPLPRAPLRRSTPLSLVGHHTALAPVLHGSPPSLFPPSLSSFSRVGGLERHFASQKSAAPPTASYTGSKEALDVITLTEKNWKAEIEDNLAWPVIVDCQADWCGPCRTLAPLLKKYVTATKGVVRLATLDVDEQFDLAHRLKITAIPAVIAFHRGKQLDKFVGLISESDVENFVKKVYDHTTFHAIPNVRDEPIK